MTVSRGGPRRWITDRELAHRLDRVGLVGGLVVAVADDPGEAQSHAAGVAGGALEAVEGDLDDLLRADLRRRVAPTAAGSRASSVNRSVCQASISSVMPLKVSHIDTFPAPQVREDTVDRGAGRT